MNPITVLVFVDPVKWVLNCRTLVLIALMHLSLHIVSSEVCTGCSSSSDYITTNRDVTSFKGTTYHEMFWEAPGCQCPPLPPKSCSSISQLWTAPELQLEHSSLSQLDPTWVSCSPFNCWTHPIAETQRWSHGILAAIEVNTPYCYFTFRAQYLHFLGSTLYRSSQGSRRTPWQIIAHEQSGEQSCLQHSHHWQTKLQSRSHNPFAITNTSPFNRLSFEYQQGQKNSLGTRF